MNRNLLKSILISLAFLSAGFSLLHTGAFGYGLSFFLFLPFILGYLFGGSLVRGASIVGLLISLVIFLALLFTGGLEGMICILMALPLVFAAIGLGVLLKFLTRKRATKSDEEGHLKSSFGYFLLFVALAVVEGKLTSDNENIVEVHSEIILPYSPMKVYDAIKSVDTLTGPKPFLMRLDLPVPHKCILEEEKIGGLRRCYFSEGQIVERITQLEKGKLLRMDVIDYQLTGRDWFSFEEAIYTFEELENGSTRMIRTTTYTSELYPRFYWEPLERIGIEQEHQYVFTNLENDLRSLRVE